MALGMTLNGAKGSTSDSMRATLELSGISSEEINDSYQRIMDYLSRSDSQVRFDIANSIWIRNGFPIEEDFIETNQNFFNAEASNLDFSKISASDIMNTWIEDNTNGKIKDMIKPPIDPAAVMFLINAIYFKGSWTTEFDKSLTRPAQFYKKDGSQIEVQMMSVKGTFPVFRDTAMQAIELPYGRSDYSMFIFLPSQETDINEFVFSLSSEKWNHWMDGFEKNEGEIFLPKFKMEYKVTLNKMLTDLGMGVAFSSLADFTGINKNGGLLISNVKHNTFLEIDEEGTEAAAATIVEISVTSTPSTLIRIDRPFVLAIVEKSSNTILFIGKIEEP